MYTYFFIEDCVIVGIYLLPDYETAVALKKFLGFEGEIAVLCE